MNRKPLMRRLVLIALLLAALAGLSACGQGEQGAGAAEQDTRPASSGGASSASPSGPKADLPAGGEEALPSPAAPSEPPGQGNGPEAPDGAGENAAPEPLTFPCAIPGTSLVLERVEDYDGIYLEDGSDREVTGVAAALIRNSGDQPVEYACVQLEGGPEFVVTGLDAGAIIVVQSSGPAAYEERAWTACSAQAAYAPSMDLAEDRVAVREAEDGSLEISNLSGAEIPCLRIFYKFYLPEQDLYVGGITYNVKLLDLASGETRTVTPSHYLPGYSRVVMVKTYDEEN